MGEIGRDRKDYLYEMGYWEILLIIRGYRRRNVLQYQLQRLQAYHALYAFRENKDGRLPDQIWPLYFDKYTNKKRDDLPTDEEVKAMKKELSRINSKKEEAT